jgi:hypothetical protein
MINTIIGFAKSKDVSYEVMRHRVKKTGIKPIRYTISPLGGRIRVYSLFDLERAFKTPVGKRKKRNPAPIIKIMRSFLSVPLTPVHRWYGFNA